MKSTKTHAERVTAVNAHLEIFQRKLVKSFRTSPPARMTLRKPYPILPLTTPFLNSKYR